MNWKKVERQIAYFENELQEYRRSCKHRRVLHVERPDSYCGWGISDTCLDCGHYVMIATKEKYPDDRPIRKVEKR